jgi:hypothetical protein
MPPEPPTPRRTPGGFLPRRHAPPKAPSGNGHASDRPLGLRRSSWEDVDAEDEQRIEAERVRFQRVADVDPRVEVRFSARPSPAVVIGVVIALGLVVLAVVLYRMAPP